jgi:hypothetical protein
VLAVSHTKVRADGGIQDPRHSLQPSIKGQGISIAAQHVQGACIAPDRKRTIRCLLQGQYSAFSYFRCS